MGVSKLILRFRKWLGDIYKSISFYPTLITLVFTFLAIVMDSLYANKLDLWILEKAPFISTTDPSTARTLLGSMIGGLMTLTVFSFTMVMVLLNQASSMYSPRLLPGLISNRRHQIVLGIYLGTLIYSVLLLIGIKDLEDSYMLPHTAIVGALFFMALSIAAFVYFIHAISTSIQIDVIINGIYADVVSEEHTYTEFDEEQEGISNEAEAQAIKSRKSGYVEGWDVELLLTICEEESVLLELCADEGDFILRGDIYAYSSQILESSVEERIRNSILISPKQVDRSRGEQGVQQLLEIAMKAMSPGINDPLTALTAIERLTLVLEIMQGRSGAKQHLRDNKLLLVENFKPYPRVLEDTLLGLREYCTQDPLVARAVTRMLSYLSKCKGAVRGGKNIPLEEL